MLRVKTAVALSALSLIAACSTSTEVTNQPTGHPYLSLSGCERIEPIGKFDAKCDVPRLGYRGSIYEITGGTGAIGSSSGGY